MPYIYKITSPSNKIYVGSTIDYKKRFSAYKRMKCKTQTKLYNSFLKHGVEKHIFEIITECELDKMLYLECYYGNLLNTLGKKGLNCVLPNKDDKFICRSQETRNKLSKNNTGRKLSEETKNKLRIINTGKISPNKGKNYHTYESKQKMSIAHTGKILSESTKLKMSISHKGKIPKNIELLRELKRKKIINKENVIFNSITECAKFYNISVTYISNMLNNKRKNTLEIYFVKK